MTPLLRRRTRRYPGLYRATVVAATDPQGHRRLQVSLPSVAGSTPLWAPTLRDLGAPAQVGDEVLVGFEEGRSSSPYVVGILATGAPAPVEICDDLGNSIRLTSAGIEVNAAMSSFSGIVKTPTLIADSVIAASYSPGVGNIS